MDLFLMTHLLTCKVYNAHDGTEFERRKMQYT